MVKSMFAGVSGLRSHQTKMDVIGNNIANVNTFGFKAGRATFKDSFYQTLTGSSAPGGAFGGANAKQIGYGTQIGSIDTSHVSGGFVPTDNPSDIMISGGGYFMVGPGVQGGIDPNNGDASFLNFTRVGIFRFDGTGNLVDPNRNMVYGFKGYSIEDTTDKMAVDFAADGGTLPVTLTASSGKQFTLDVGGDLTPVAPATAADLAAIATPDAVTGGAPYTLKASLTDQNKLVPIQFPKDATGKPMKLSNVTFGVDGTITGVPEGADRIITVGKVAIANVPNPNGLEQTQSSYFKAKENTGLVTAHVPGEGTTGTIEASVLESSNVDMSKEFTEMITTQRGFQANTKIITVSDQMLEELVNLKR